ncbi:secreted protein with C-terminal beta-propeller domain [Thiovulum sp. ES]|nr:secreted protein with C-terminal beta-propeller domain [Thiovulum sp. ES]
MQYPSLGNIYMWKSGAWVKNSGDINPTDGVWIYTNKDLYIQEKYDENQVSDITKLELERGWNLLSLPLNLAISQDVFKNEKAVWKYSGGQWSKYKHGFSGESSYPDIGVIGTGEGFWVLSETEKTIDLDETSELQNFESNESMENFLLSMVRYNRNFRYNSPHNYYYDEGFVYSEMEVDSSDSAGDNSEKVSDITTTNTQEELVDEADIVKHDGNKIFYLPNGRYENKILVTTFSEILSGNNEAITEIETEQKPDELYLVNDKLIAIYPTNNYYWNSWCYVDYSIWSETSRVEVYDVSDIENIVKTEDFNISGNIVDTRVTGGKLFVVSRFMPSIEIEYEKEVVECEEKEECYYYYLQDDNGTYYEINYDKYTEVSADLIAKINDKPLYSNETLFAPKKIDQSPFITSITSFQIEDFSKMETISAVGGSETLYASTEAIYIVSSDYPRYWNWRNYDERIAIYKFGISNELSYNGKTFLDGRILNQFSLSEYDEVLRVATTKVRSWWSGGDTDNIVSSIVEKNGTLEIVGEISGLGKEGETIRGVRFLGDKGYIVTFRQTDPLYVVDFSNPEKPVLGENPLEIDGYSTYFHPVNSDLILSLGVNADSDGTETGYQIQLFNVSDFNNPTLVDKVLLPETQDEYRWKYYSEAVHNHKAFTYRNSDNLFAVSLQEHIEEEMTDEQKIEYLAQNYTNINDLNISEVEEWKEKYAFEISQGIEFYVENHYLDYGYYYYPMALTDIYFPSYHYQNTLNFYSVDTNESYINIYNSIDGGKSAYYNGYDYQRSVIFSTGEEEKTDWGLYILGGKFYLEEIIK